LFLEKHFQVRISEIVCDFITNVKN